MTNRSSTYLPDPAEQPASRASAFMPKAEGDDNLFTQSWFPVCTSDEASQGAVKSFGFLDGRVIVFRNADGEPRVLSAYCPHMGANLESGDVVDGNIRCGFHHWQFDAEGRCIKTGVGDPVPSKAKLFAYPCVERWGIIFAFNGLEPLWELPDFQFDDSELTFKSFVIDGNMPVDPWIQCANTPDMQHIKTMHGVSFDCEDPDDEVSWTPFSMSYKFDGQHRKGELVKNHVAVYGTSLYWQETEIDGRWFGFLVPMGLVSPSCTRNYIVLCARTDGGTKEDVSNFIDAMIQLELSVVGEDTHVLSHMRFRPGTLTRGDKTLSRFLRYVNNFPRAHPGRSFIT